MTTANGQPRILVVEDDAAVRNLIATALDSYGYARVVAVTGREAIARAATDNPDLVLLDLGLPDIDGVEVVRSIRGWSQMPIIVVSARAEDADKIDALDAGADDYVTKPFSVGELLARIRSALRRLSYAGAAAAEATPSPSVFEDGDLRIDYDAGIVTLAGISPPSSTSSSASSRTTSGRSSPTTTSSTRCGEMAKGATLPRFGCTWGLSARRSRPTPPILATSRRMLALATAWLAWARVRAPRTTPSPKRLGMGNSASGLALTQ